MLNIEETANNLAEIPNLQVSQNALLSAYTRFGIGGPADIFAQTSDVDAFLQASAIIRASALNHVVIGSGTNLIVSDAGFRGIVLRFTSDRILRVDEQVTVDSGAVLQDLVDFTVNGGLKGLETLAGIPGSVGAAIYGNAGAYGHSISERIQTVRFHDGERVRTFHGGECEFLYRESIFKRNRTWIIFSAELAMEPHDREALRKIADDIVRIRNEKFPPTMKCAGSVFKNLLLAELPPQAADQVPANVVREGKVPAAYFLEQVQAKGMQRGDIHVAAYHANLLYNAGAGTARDLCRLIAELKARVFERYGFQLEEEVQYVGFDAPVATEETLPAA